MATPTDRIDRPRSVRAGEELDVVRLRPWLAGALHRDVADIVIEQFPSGYSNLTYLVNVGSHEYVLRRPPVGNRVESAHDMLREYRILEKLHPVYSLAPRPVAACSDVEILGAPFYLMERRRGVIWRGQPMALATDAARNRQLGDALADNLAALHGLDIEATGLFEFGKPAGYISRQVAGWTKRINAAKTDDIPAVAQVADWLAASIPAQLPPVMLHNDYKHDNVIFAADLPAEIVAVLDWEMATVGDYRMDLGTTLAYWVQADDPPEFHPVAMCPTSLPGCPTRAEFAARYFAARQIPAVDLTFFYCYGLFKVAGIVQQIYSRYRAGLTTDPRFARLNETVVALAPTGAPRDCCGAIVLENNSNRIGTYSLMLSTIGLAGLFILCLPSVSVVLGTRVRGIGLVASALLCPVGLVFGLLALYRQPSRRARWAIGLGLWGSLYLPSLLIPLLR